jgi:hypothetical protein
MSECGGQPHEQPVPSYNAGCSLENLAPELKIEIMKSLDDAVSLRSLVLASRSFYTTYLHARRIIFEPFVLKQLDSRLWPDIQMLAETKSFYSQGARTPREVVALIDRYSRSRQTKSAMDLDSLSLQEICELYRTHVRMTQVLNDFFSSISIKMPKSGPLSDHEKIRLYQALYRLQVFNNLTNYQSNIDGPELPLDIHGRNPSPHEGFVPSFLVWEGDAMACICEHLVVRWLELLRECAVGASQEQKDRPHFEGSDGHNILRIVHSFPEAEDSTFVALFGAISPWLTVNPGQPCPPSPCPPYMSCYLRLISSGPEYLGSFLSKDIARRCEDLLVLGWWSGRNWSFRTHHHVSYQTPRRPTLVSPVAIKPHEVKNIQARLLQIIPDERPSAGWMWFALKHNFLSTNLEGSRYFNRIFDSDAISDGPALEIFTPDAKHELLWGFPFWDVERLRDFGALRAFSGGEMETG